MVLQAILRLPAHQQFHPRAVVALEQLSLAFLLAISLARDGHIFDYFENGVAIGPVFHIRRKRNLGVVGVRTCELEQGRRVVLHGAAKAKALITLRVSSRRPPLPRVRLRLREVEQVTAELWILLLGRHRRHSLVSARIQLFF